VGRSDVIDSFMGLFGLELSKKLREHQHGGDVQNLVGPEHASTKLFGARYVTLDSGAPTLTILFAGARCHRTCRSPDLRRSGLVI
jgi:hypothetical protein